MSEFFKLLPSSFIIITFLMISLLSVTRLKYSLKKTLLIVIPFLLALIAINTNFFSNYDLDFFNNWSVITVFLPEFILAYILGKKKGVSKVVAIIDAYVAFYMVILLKNISKIYVQNIILEYVIYLIFIPLLLLYFKKFYNSFHNELEKLIPKFLILLGVYSIFIFVEFYTYSYLIQDTDLHVLRLEIFGVAIISIYIISLGFFSLLIKYYKNTFITANEKELVDHQLKAIVNQEKIRNEKEEELKIIRHDMKHILITTSSLINEKKYDDAIEVINSYVAKIDENKINRYCNDPIINAIINYYKNLCIQNKINLKIKIKNIEKALKINSSDVAILISNCFDNAINATKKLKNNRLIEFKFINHDDKLILQMKNNYNGNIQYDKNNMPTNLKENHGIGTQSITSFCKRNNLILDYEINENTFILNIIF